MDKKCGVYPALFFSLIALRCATPNRCCSSTTTNPSCGYFVVSCSSACVQTMMHGSFGNFTFFFVCAVISTIGISSAPHKIFCNVCACCSASICVGASKIEVQPCAAA